MWLRRKRIGYILALGLLLAAPVLVFSQVHPEDVVGSWEMEDVYTLQLHPTRGLAIESHQPGRFTYRVQLRRDGSGTINGDAFVWSLLEDEMLWRFPNGVRVETLVRFLTEDQFLLLALGSDQNYGPVGSISSLRRQ